MDSLKDSIGILSAAIIGSFIGTATKRTDSPFSMIVSVVAGISSAYIFTPILSLYINIGIRTDYGIAFLLGLLGMSIISIGLNILEIVKNDPKLIIAFIKEIIFKEKSVTINNYKSDSSDKKSE